MLGGEGCAIDREIEMKVREELKEIRSLEADELLRRATVLEEELMHLRFRHSAGQLDHTAQLRALRCRIARLRTVIVEKAEEAKGAA